VGELEQLGCWLTPACQVGKLPISCTTQWCILWWVAFPLSKRTDWTFHHMDTGGQSFILTLNLFGHATAKSSTWRSKSILAPSKVAEYTDLSCVVLVKPNLGDRRIAVMCFSQSLPDSG